jgi:hypothetical protein
MYAAECRGQVPEHADSLPAVEKAQPSVAVQLVGVFFPLLCFRLVPAYSLSSPAIWYGIAPGRTDRRLTIINQARPHSLNIATNPLFHQLQESWSGAQ